MSKLGDLFKPDPNHGRFAGNTRTMMNGPGPMMKGMSVPPGATGQPGEGQGSLGGQLMHSAPAVAGVPGMRGRVPVGKPIAGASPIAPQSVWPPPFQRRGLPPASN